MAFVSYEARRALVFGHSAGTVYDLPLTLTDCTPPAGGDLKETQTSIDGSIETQYYGEIRTWSVTLAPVRYADAGQLQEFLRSTADGQSFTFDPFGSVGHPVQALTVVRADSGYTPTPFQREGRGGFSDSFSFTFQVREI